jgi:putative addiction module component (TIGR02574 family)
MAVTLKSLGLDRLSRADRLALAQALWESAAAEDGAPLLSEAQRGELERRAAEDEANPDDVVAWDEVRDRARAQFRK